MPPRDMTTKQIQQEILHRLYRRRYWGAKYLPQGSLINWLGQLVKNNGQRVRASIDELVRLGFLISHKKGSTLSLNPRMKKEVTKNLQGLNQA
jgi:hypothetical protein